MYVAPLPATTIGVVAATPDRANAKSAASTPVTGSLNVTVYTTLAVLVFGPAGVVRPIAVTCGGTRSIVYVGPVKFPLPVPSPPNRLPSVSRIESSSVKFSPSVPCPLIPLTVTVYVAPLPATSTGVTAVTPDKAKAKSPASTPVTALVNVTVYSTVAALVSASAGVVRTIDWTAGGVWSSVYACPAKSPLPAPGPPKRLPATSCIESSSAKSSRNVPLPLIPLTVTVYAAPLPATSTSAVAVTPDRAKAKSPASTPVTGSRKVTVYTTLDAFVAGPTGVVRSIDCTVGGVKSITNSSVVPSVPVLPARSVAAAVTGYVPSGNASPAGIVSVQSLPLTDKFPSPAVYVWPWTDTCSVPSLIVPVMVGVVSLVVRPVTVTVGGVVSLVTWNAADGSPAFPTPSVATAV